MVYKSGNAGVRTATVTLNFDNTDENHKPIGYERVSEISITRQVVVGGKNKYLINGKNVVNKKVHDLFGSVQLNVNNPHFLIMQGRITKVLNMKPPEILSMIEEAAGTSMYEQKREHTTKLMEKKDGKIQEMETLLKEEIEPKLDKLREEQKVYKEYQQLEREIEYLNRINKSHLYLRYKEGVKNTEDQIAEIQQNVEADNQKIVDNENEVKNIENVLLEIQQKIDDESGGELTELDKLLSVKTKEDASNSAKEKSTKDKIQIEDRKVKALQKSIKEDEVALEQKENEMSKVRISLGKFFPKSISSGF